MFSDSSNMCWYTLCSNLYNPMEFLKSYRRFDSCNYALSPYNFLRIVNYLSTFEITQAIIVWFWKAVSSASENIPFPTGKAANCICNDLSILQSGARHRSGNAINQYVF